MKNAETMNEIASHIFIPVALFQIGSVFECWLKALSIWDNAKTLNAMVLASQWIIDAGTNEVGGQGHHCYENSLGNYAPTRSFSKSVPVLTGLCFMMFLLAGSTPKARAGKVAVAKFTHRICTANNGASQLNKVATNKVVISAMLPTNKN